MSEILYLITRSDIATGDKTPAFSRRLSVAIDVVQRFDSCLRSISVAEWLVDIFG